MIREIDQDETDSSKVLETLLETRFDLLRKRAEKHQETKKYVLKHESLPEHHFLPTDPESISDLGLLDQKSVKNAIERYQYLNLIIFHLYKLNNPISLPIRVKQLISGSRTLWPILNEEITDLSYPDFATFTYDDDPEELKNHKDYNYFWSNFMNIKYEIEYKNWGSRKGVIIGSYLEAGCYGAIPLPEPEWLYPVSVKEEETVIENLKISDHSESVSQKKKRRRKRTKAQTNPPEKKNFMSQEDLTDLLSIENDTQKTEKEEESSSILPEEKVLQEPQASTQLKLTSAPNALIDRQEKEKKQIEDKRLSLKISDEKKKEIPLRPRGMRQFHVHEKSNLQSSEPVSFLNRIGRKDSTLIATIFDPEMKGQGFTFREFKKLWEKLNGQGTVRSSGGSHYALLNSERHVISGTFAHGEGQTYTRKTVRYLRDALNMIGASPKE